MNYHKLNNFLLAAIILINGYVLLAPLWPEVVYHFESHTGREKQLIAQIQPKVSKSATAAKTPAAPQPNHVVIPSMLLDQPIYQGPESQQYKILDKGIWLFQWGSTPDQGGNTVLIGHRFTYTNPRGVFYFLNKVAIGDPIAIYWNNKEYLYTVNNISVVPPTDTAIEGRSSRPEVTLFTCTPLILPENRLVIVAYLESIT